MNQKFRSVAFTLGVALVSYFALMQNAQVALRPHVWVLEWLYGISFAYVPEIGYYSAAYQFAITDSCMGARFFVAAYLVLCLGFPLDVKSPLKRAAKQAQRYFFALAAGFALTIVRIALSLPFTGLEIGQLIHNFLSLISYFGGLLALYVFMQRRSRNGFRK